MISWIEVKRMNSNVRNIVFYLDKKEKQPTRKNNCYVELEVDIIYIFLGIRWSFQSCDNPTILLNRNRVTRNYYHHQGKTDTAEIVTVLQKENKNSIY